MKITIGSLRRLIKEAVILEGDLGAETPEANTSLDAQVDRYLADYERTSVVAKHEARDWRMTVKRLLGEAGEDDEDAGDEGDEGDEDKKEPEKPEEPPKKTLDDINVETFADDVARLITNAENLIEFNSTITRRAKNFLAENYDPTVVDAFVASLRDNHGIMAGKTENDVEDEFAVAPRAANAGPGGGG